MSSVQRILILDRDLGPRSGLALAPEREGDDLVADTVASISEALANLVQKGYDGVLCRVDSPQELSFLIRIRHASPTMPLVAITPHDQCTLDDLSRQSGADEVRSRRADFHQEQGTARRNIGVHELIERTRAALARSQELHVQHQVLVAQTKRNLAKSQALLKDRLAFVGPLLKGFLPLLVEGDPRRASLIRTAFEKTSIPFPLDIMGSAEAAISALAGKTLFFNPSRALFPNLVLLDLDLPNEGAFEVLRWIRSHPETDDIMVFGLTDSHELFDKAMALGAENVYPKPAELLPLKAQVRAMAIRWSMLEEARALWMRDLPPQRA